MKREERKGSAHGETRRKFLKKTAGLVAGGTLLGRPAFVLGAGPTVTIVLDPDDRSVSEGPVRWAAGQLARTADMAADGSRFRSQIPGDYTDSRYPLVYFFEVRDGRGQAWLFPGLEADPSNQPYFLVRSV